MTAITYSNAVASEIENTFKWAPKGWGSRSGNPLEREDVLLQIKSLKRVMGDKKARLTSQESHL